jgi:CheY-like chemotaxis protein
LSFGVEDTGPGIAPEEQGTLFEPFVQSRHTTQEGTGLGLTISRQFAQLLGGEITLSSQFQHGSTFKLTLPIEVADPSACYQTTRHPIVGLAPDQPEYRILIVEDNWANRRLLVELLQPTGFQVQVAVNGQEAIEMWKQWHPHLIWMDLQMPIMTGWEATRLIRQQAQESAQPIIIALTASVFESDRAQILATGCNDCVHKPFQDQVILDKIGQYLGAHYLYAEAEPTGDRSPAPFDLSAESLAVMPADWRQRLCQAATHLDKGQVLKLIEQIPTEHSSLAQALHQCVSNYDFELILHLNL